MKDILTLLKANIRYKRGSFISVIILTVIIAASITLILSIKDNSDNSIENAYESVNAGNGVLIFRDEQPDEDIVEKAKEHPLVKSIRIDEAVISNEQEFESSMYSSSWLMHDEKKGLFEVFNDDLDGFVEEPEPLKHGEIYISQGTSVDIGGGCGVGSTIKLKVAGEYYDFTVKALIQEPMFGTMVIGMKNVYISSEDYADLYEKAEAASTEERRYTVNLMNLFKTDDCGMSDGAFLRTVNSDTGIVDYASLSITKEALIHYTKLLPQVVISSLMAFMLILTFIVIVAIGHSISTSIEMNYKNLGVMKAQGFTKNRIRFLFGVQYLLAEIIGMIVGVLLALPMIKLVGNVFQPITSILTDTNVSLMKSILVMLAIIAVSGVFILFATAKIGKISPINAINDSDGDVYFDSRLNVPVFGKALGTTLALRQFTSAKRRYAILLAIVAGLVFFMVTVSALGASFTSTSAIESIGAIYSELDLQFDEGADEEEYIDEIESTIEKYTGIEKKYYIETRYLSFENEQIMCMIYKNPEVINTIKGRPPKYDNEICITEIIKDTYGVGIGDEVTLGHKDNKRKYIITGYYANSVDTGNNAAMTSEGARKLGVEHIRGAYYKLEDPEYSVQIADELNERFSSVLEAKGYTEEELAEMTSMYTTAVGAIKAVIFGFSIIFSLVVVIMICSRTFARERRDIGIYKAIGFTSRQLRVQFALRFMIVSAVGSVFGTLLSLVLTNKMLTTLLRGVGITNLHVEYNASVVLIPAAVICACIFAFSYIVSRKIKKVSTSELITE